MNSMIKKRLVEFLLSEKDNRRILIDKEGVSEEIANWAHNLSDKLSIWIVKSLKDKYARAMANLSNKVSLDDYYQSLTGDYEDIIGLLKKDNRPQININTLTFDEARDLVNKYHYIEAWLNDATNQAQAELGQGFLKNKSWDEAVAMADEWHQSLTAGGDVQDLLDDKDEVIHVFDDGFQWVLRKSNTCSKSRESMGHCATASKPHMYLLRLIKGNREFITVDWDPNTGVVMQLKGLNNKKPISKYHPYITWLIKDWGGVKKLLTNVSYLPQTNFQLGELDPEIAASIVGNNPDIIDIDAMLDFTPNPNKPKLISNLLRYDLILKQLIPNGFADFFGQVENKNIVIGAVLNSPDFLEKMNRYKGYLTDTIERMLNATSKKDLLIQKLLERKGLIELLDSDGEALLIDNSSDPDIVRDAIFQNDFSTDDEMSNELAEGINIKLMIISELRKIT